MAHNPIVEVRCTFPIQVIPAVSVAPPGFEIGDQPTGERIVPSTKQTYQGTGYVVGLTGASQAPVLLRFFGKKSGHAILRPGEVLRVGEFDAFEYGLPFGWCGGGLSVLKVGTTPDVVMDMGGNKAESIYWRTRLVVEADADPLPTLKRNWPSKFPWEYAYAAAGANQKGVPTLPVEPTRTVLYLPDAGLAAGIVLGTTYNARLFFRSAVDPYEGDYAVDVSFVAPAGGLIYPGIISVLPAEFDRLDLNNGGVTIVSPDGTLAVGDYIIATRYGRF